MRHLALSAAIRHRIATRLSRHHHVVVFGVVVDGKWANKRVASKKRTRIKRRGSEGPTKQKHDSIKEEPRSTNHFRLSLPISPHSQLPFPSPASGLVTRLV
jgi:hypothetical protein